MKLECLGGPWDGKQVDADRVASDYTLTRKDWTAGYYVRSLFAATLQWQPTGERVRPGKEGR